MCVCCWIWAPATTAAWMINDPTTPSIHPSKATLGQEFLVITPFLFKLKGADPFLGLFSLIIQAHNLSYTIYNHNFSCTIPSDYWTLAYTVRMTGGRACIEPVSCMAVPVICTVQSPKQHQLIRQTRHLLWEISCHMVPRFLTYHSKQLLKHFLYISLIVFPRPHLLYLGKIEVTMWHVRWR